MTSVTWCDRNTDIHNFRHARKPSRIDRVQVQMSHINFTYNTIFNKPEIWYANFDREATTPALRQHLPVDAPYLTAFLYTTINPLVIPTIDGLNQEGNEVAKIMYQAYERLHTIVEDEIEVKR
jgi:hypothetical protein